MRSVRKRQRPSRRTTGAWFSWVAARILIAIVSFLPFRVVNGLSYLLAIIFYWFIPIRRQIVEQNLEIACGDSNRSSRSRLIRSIYHQFFLLICENAHLTRLTQDELRQTMLVDPESLEMLTSLINQNRGLILATGHFGNWEWGTAWIGMHTNRKVGAIYKPLHNPWIDSWLLRQRARLNVILYSTREHSPRLLYSLLRKGELVGMLSDQDAGSRGVFIPFFGRPASTAFGMARLAVHQGATIVPIFSRRIAPGRFQVQIFPPLVPDPAADPNAEEMRLMLGYHEALEKMVRQWPEQYFWWHRRWKTLPPSVD